MNYKSKKLFVGFFLPDEWVQKVSKIQQALSGVRGLRWTSSENLHITNLYMGEVNAAKIDQISAALNEVSIKTRPFELTFNSLLAAPIGKEPSMVWVEFKHSHEFGFLANDIKKAVSSVTIIEEEEKKLIPHVTIARAKNWPKLTLPNLTLKDPTLKIDRFCLVESESRRDEPNYHIIKEFEFKSYNNSLYTGGD